MDTNFIKGALKDRKKTRTDLSDWLNKPLSTIDYKLGTGSFTCDEMVILSKKLRKSIDYLITGLDYLKIKDVN